MDLLTALSGGPLLAILAVLALVDSTSFGTLAIPTWLLLAPGRVRAGRMLMYLATIAGFYFAVGLAVLLGAGWFLENYAGVLGSRPAQVLGLLLGVALVIWSFRLDSPAARQRARAGTGRLARWRRAATGQGHDGGSSGSGGGLGPLMGLALAAGLVEVASMLPYLAAIGLIAGQGPGWPASGALLAGYCLVMVTPALVLLAGRLVARRVLERPLARLDAWFSRHSAGALSWVVGIIGAVLVVNTAPAVLSVDTTAGAVLVLL